MFSRMYPACISKAFTSERVDRQNLSWYGFLSFLAVALLLLHFAFSTYSWLLVQHFGRLSLWCLADGRTIDTALYKRRLGSRDWLDL